MSIYRQYVWYKRGCKHYTKAGFEAASKRFVPKDLDVDVSDTSFMVTGANTGLGLSTAKEIAKRKGTVHLVCRNEERGNQAKNEIVEETSNTNVHLHIVDMSKPKQVAEFASAFNEPLDVLINNASVLVNERTKTEDNLDVNFATNTIGSYILTRGLIPLLLKSKQPRVIFVSSGGMLVQRLNYSDFNFDKMTKYDGVMAYAQTKRQQVVMTEQLAKAYPKIYFASMHPGWSLTPGVESSMPKFAKAMENKLRTPEQGADTIVWLALYQNLEKSAPSGEFFEDRMKASKHLPCACTHTSEDYHKTFMNEIKSITDRLGIKFPEP